MLNSRKSVNTSKSLRNSSSPLSSHFIVFVFIRTPKIMTSRRASSNTMFLWKMQSNTNFMQIKMESHELFATLCLLSSLFNTRDFVEIWMSLSFYRHRIVGIVFHSFVITLVESYLNSKSFVKIENCLIDLLFFLWFYVILCFFKRKFPIDG